jgi:hypothetical protein
MGIYTKTVEYSIPLIATVAPSTNQDFTPITVYLPETDKTITQVLARISAGSRTTASSTGAQKVLTISLGGAGTQSQTAIVQGSSSSTTYHTFHDFVDFTSYFQTNWSGTSMSLDGNIRFDPTGSFAEFINVSITFIITYSYENTSTTHVKTVKIPLFATNDRIPLTKPGTPQDIIPNLSTELPELSKTFRNISLVIESGNGTSATTVKQNIVIEIGSASISLVNYTSTAAVNINSGWRLGWELTSLIDTEATQDFFLYSSGTGAHVAHPHIYLVVTYEFSASTSSSCYCSVSIPFSYGMTRGVPSANNDMYTKINILEPGTIVFKKLFCFGFSHIATAVSSTPVTHTLENVSKSFNLYGTGPTGSATFMNSKSGISLVRGENIFKQSFIANSSGVTNTNPVSGILMLNYVSDKPLNGYGAENRTIYLPYNLKTVSISNVTLSSTTSATLVEDHYFNALGYNLIFQSNSSTAFTKLQWLTEYLSDEVYRHQFEITELLYAMTSTPGIKQQYVDLNNIYKKYLESPVGISIFSSRRHYIGHFNLLSLAAYLHITLIGVVHSNTFLVSGDITNSEGGQVDLALYNENNTLLKKGNRTGNGAYSFSWYSDLEKVYVTARETNTLLGISKLDYPGT